MPTGYTAAIEDGIDFPTFALNCARAFGACVELRDEPGGGEVIPDAFEPSDYHSKAIERILANMQTLLSMTPEERVQAAEKQWQENEAQRLRTLDRKKKLELAYLVMLNKVKEWEPPTEDHAQLKTFMQEQIRESIRFDCATSYAPEPSLRLSADEWHKQSMDDYIRDLAYHRENDTEEKKRAKDRTEWVKALRQSLIETMEG
jgi:hypothetical protein